MRDDVNARTFRNGGVFHHHDDGLVVSPADGVNVLLAVTGQQTITDEVFLSSGEIHRKGDRDPFTATTVVVCCDDRDRSWFGVCLWSVRLRLHLCPPICCTAKPDNHSFCA